MESLNPFGAFKHIGGAGHASGPGRFIFQSILVGTGLAAITGGGMAIIAAALFEAAALPFVVGTAVGFTAGIVTNYFRSINRALIDLELYPGVLRLHLMRHFPAQRYDRRPLQWFDKANFQGRWQEESRLIVAWVSGQENLDEIRSRLEAEAVDLASGLPTATDDSVPKLING